MAIISIQKSELRAADQLALALNRRMGEVIWHDAADSPTADKPAKPVDAFVCSAAYAEACGGQSAIIEAARAMKAAKVLVVGDDAAAGFSVTHEMRGAIIMLNMAASDCSDEMLKPNIAHNYSVQMAASLLLDNEHVAVADKSSLDLMALAQKVSKTDVTVFINGPTGTGKEVLSKFIHHQSARKEAPFVAVNCALSPKICLRLFCLVMKKGHSQVHQQPIRAFSEQLTGVPCC